MSVRVIASPLPVVDVPTARARLGIPVTTDDATITALILAATQAIDGPTGWLNRAIGVQTLALSLSGFPCNQFGAFWAQRFRQQRDDAPTYSIELPYPEIISVTQVAYTDPTGAAQILDPATYSLVDRMLVPAFGTPWPVSQWAPGSVTIQYQAGYQAVPETIKQAILLSVSQTRSMSGRDPMLTTDTVYGVGSQQFSPNGGVGFSSAVQAMLEPFRVIE